MTRSPTSRPGSADELAHRLTQLERAVQHMRLPQLSNSSVEGGTLDFNDELGNLMVTVGQQPDGTAAPLVVGGPPPPGISGVEAYPIPSGIMVRWDGSWLSDPAVAPLDFSRVEIHASHEGADFEPELVGDGSLTMQGSIGSARGGRFVVSGLSYENYWIKLVPRTLTGKWGEATPAIGPIMPGRLTQSDIEDTVLSAGFVLTGVIQVGEIGQPNPLLLSGTEGFVAPQPDGGEIRFPVDGSPARITAKVIAYTLVVKDQFALYGEGQLSGEIVITDSVRSPSAAPSLSVEWPRIGTALGVSNEDAGVANRVQGLTDHHSEPHWLVSAISSTVGQSRVSTLRLIHRTTGQLTAYPDPSASADWVWNFESIGGVTRIGDSYFMLGLDHIRKGTYVYRISGLTWEKTAEWEIGNSMATFVSRPRLLTDGTRVGVVWVPTDGALTLRWYSTTGAIQGSDIAVHPAYPGRHELGDAYYGEGGAGVTRLWVASRLGDVSHPTKKVRAYDISGTPALDTARNFMHANNDSLIGLHFDEQQGRMVSLQGSCALSTYSKYTTVPTIRVVYTWYDGDNSPYPPGTFIDGVDVSGLASGVRETNSSPMAEYIVPQRSWLVIETPPPPDEQVTDPTIVDRANRVGVYVSVDFSPYVRHAYLPNSSGMAGRIVRGVDTFPTSGPTPPTVNGFLAAKAQPGVLRSGALRLDGTPRARIEGSGEGNFDGLIAPGMMMFWPRPVPPPGWLLCEGQDVSRTDYPDLYDAFYHQYGVGDGSTTFTMPPDQTAIPGMFLVAKT